MDPLKPDEDKYNCGSLVLDFGIWGHHIKTVICLLNWLVTHYLNSKDGFLYETLGDTKYLRYNVLVILEYSKSRCLKGNPRERNSHLTQCSNQKLIIISLQASIISYLSEILELVLVKLFPLSFQNSPGMSFTKEMFVKTLFTKKK